MTFRFFIPSLFFRDNQKQLSFACSHTHPRSRSSHAQPARSSKMMGTHGGGGDMHARTHTHTHTHTGTNTAEYYSAYLEIGISQSLHMRVINKTSGPLASG